MIPKSIPVGMYHHVNHHTGDFITVSVPNFRRQMQWLRRRRYETLNADSFLAALRGEYRPARRCCVLTFDDAWLDVHSHAFPTLKEFGHQFIVFAVSDWTEQASRESAPGAPGRPFPTHNAAETLVHEQRAGEVICAWRHLREMVDSGLCSVENHSASHRDATALAPDILRQDLLRCRDGIHDNLGRESRHLCWPLGAHNGATLALARQLGFEVTYLVRRGVNVAGGGSFAVKRFTVEDRDERWFQTQLRIFSSPVAGLLYARLKPDRWFRRKGR
jgi:biofilm PGA synthesis lipoprotein PgaB